MFFLLSLSLPGTAVEKHTQWSIQEIHLSARNAYHWWEFPAQAVFTHENGEQITINAFWNGNMNWIVRHTPTLPGH